MTVIVRRPKAAVVRRRPINERYPCGQRVSVVEDFGQDRYTGRHGTVVSTSTEREDVYPRGRVEVRLVIDELYSAVFGGRPPKTVWFKPSDLERQA